MDLQLGWNPCNGGHELIPLDHLDFTILISRIGTFSPAFGVARLNLQFRLLRIYPPQL